jgi:hypothetical protein
MLFDQITSTYKEILDEKNTAEGQYERRLLINSNELQLPVFVGLNVPSNLYYFSFLIPKELAHLVKNDHTSGLKIALRDYDEISQRLYISLESQRFSDIFIRLAEDLLNFILDPSDTRKIIIKLSNRLNKWKEFFKEDNISPLSKERCIGLIGEIILLNQLLELDPSISTLLIWKGPFESVNDFINKYKSIEVKTSASKAKDFVHISSEFQLDISDTESLHLAVIHLESDAVESKGFSLNELVKKTMVNKNELWCAHFKLALKAAGYDFDLKGRLENQRYSLIKINLYKVNPKFPRITKSDLAENISDVNYKLTLTGLEEFMENKDKILKDFIS